ILGAVADAAQGTLVAADLPDQAGAVRDLVASYRRARASEARTEQGKLRAWLPLLCAVALLVTQAITRRTAALIGLALWGLLAPREAMADSAARDARLADAERAYREALLLRPHDLGAKWNLELAVRQQHGGSSSRSNPPSGGSGGPQSGGGGGSSRGRAQG